MIPREFYETIGSTQDRAVELARAGTLPGTRVVARHQTKGRGRLDHAWWSPEGRGLYLSIVLEAPPPPRTRLALAIGEELGGELERRFGIGTALKWPNDLLVVRGDAVRKISGILIDEVGGPDRLYEIAGIGVNVRSIAHDAPEELRARVTAIEDHVRPPPSLEEVEEWTSAAAMRAVEELKDPTRASLLLDRCRDRLYGRGRAVTVDGVPMGRIDTLGDEGELWIVRGRDRIAIRAGDVDVLAGP